MTHFDDEQERLRERRMEKDRLIRMRFKTARNICMSGVHCSYEVVSAYMLGLEYASKCTILNFAPTPWIAWEELSNVIPQEWKLMSPCYSMKKLRISFNQIKSNYHIRTEYDTVIMKFDENSKNVFKFCPSVIRVENVFAWLMYELKKCEITKLYGACKEYKLFHGIPTIDTNNIGIFMDNFDWRRFGSNKGHQFGRGISFSPLSSYASHYTEENSSFSEGVNIMVMANVLVAGIHVGDENTTVPPTGCDTTCKPDLKVLVKYDDYTCYPEYIVGYSGNLSHQYQTSELRMLRLLNTELTSRGANNLPTMHSYYCDHIFNMKVNLEALSSEKCTQHSMFTFENRGLVSREFGYSLSSQQPIRIEYEPQLPPPPSFWTSTIFITLTFAILAVVGYRYFSHHTPSYSLTLVRKICQHVSPPKPKPSWWEALAIKFFPSLTPEPLPEPCWWEAWANRICNN